MSIKMPMNTRRRRVRLFLAAASLLLPAFFAPTPAAAQSLSVSPVSLRMPPGQRATVLTIRNDGDHETTFQIRGFAWNQPKGVDQLDPTDLLVVSPPLGSIPPGGRQVVRLVLRRSAQQAEDSYRILLDQVPPAPKPGVIAVALRFSIPIFVEPSGQAAAHLRWSVESEGGQYYLTGTNDGRGHAVVREMRLVSSGGQPLEIEHAPSPYILPGITRRWRILTPGFAPSPDDVLRLSTRSEKGPIEDAVPVRRATTG